MVRSSNYPKNRKSRHWDQHGAANNNPGRPTDEELAIDPRDKEVEPPAEDLRPRPVLIRVAGAVAIPSWDIEGHTIKDQLVGILKSLSNRPAGIKGLPSGQYIALESQILPNDGAQGAPINARRHGVATRTMDDIHDELLSRQGQSVKELLINLFPDAPAPPVLEPRLRATLHRLKLKGWAEARYDDSGTQRWYVISPDGVPKEWRAMERAIGYKLAEVLGGKPYEYARQVEAIAALIEAQGERAAVPDAWIVSEEKPY